MTTTHACPITGETILANETVSRTATAQLATLVSDLPDLMNEINYALAGLRNGQPPSGLTPHSRPPINLSLLEDIDDMRDSLNTWAAALQQWALPGSRFRNGDWRHIRAVFTELADKARTWQEAPAMIDEVRHSIRRLEHLASPKRDSRTYFFRCQYCGADVVVRENEATACCVACQEVVDVAQVRRSMFSVLEHTPMSRERARWAAEIITGRRLPSATLRSWVRRGKLQSDEYGRYTPRQITELMSA